MTLETATYIDDLNSLYPEAGAYVSGGDDHLRLVKSVLLASFPNIAGAMTSSHTELNYLDGTTPGTAVASKALACDSNKDLAGLRNLDVTGDITLQTTATGNNTLTLSGERTGNGNDTAVIQLANRDSSSASNTAIASIAAERQGVDGLDLTFSLPVSGVAAEQLRIKADGELRASGTTCHFGYYPGTTAAVVKLGYGRSGDGNSYLDLISDATNQFTYSGRLIRNSGVDGLLSLTNKGTGGIRLWNADNAQIEFYQNAALSGYFDTARKLNLDYAADVAPGSDITALTVNSHATQTTVATLDVKRPDGQSGFIVPYYGGAFVPLNAGETDTAGSGFAFDVYGGGYVRANGENGYFVVGMHDVTSTQIVTKQAATSSGSITVHQNSSGSTVAGITNTGNVQGTGAYTNLSDESVKEDIQDLGPGASISAIARLRPRKFKRKGQSKHEVGFVAQEVQAVLPEAVVPWDEDSGLLGIQETQMIPILVDAFKGLLQRIEALEAQG